MVQRNKVIWYGDLYNGAEQWSIGVNFMPAASTPASYVTTQDDLNSWAAAIAGTFENTAYGILLNGLSGAGSLQGVITQKFNNANELERQSVPGENLIEGLGNAYKPAQTAICVSLLTGTPGASYRGRVYLPGAGAGVDIAGMLNTPTAPQDVADTFADILELVQDSCPVADPVRPCVYSPTRNILTPVSSIRVGSVPDTQRRRRDNLVETYVASSFPPA